MVIFNSYVSLPEGNHSKNMNMERIGQIEALIRISNTNRQLWGQSPFSLQGGSFKWPAPVTPPGAKWTPALVTRCDMGGTRGGEWQIDKVDCTLPAYSLLIQHSYIENGQFTADLRIKTCDFPQLC